MKTKKLFTTFAIVSVVLISACKKSNDPSPAGGPPLMVIPVQTTAQASVALGGAFNFAILGGSAVSNTGATTVTGDLGLSPGTSIGGFPPGILYGTQHINDITANQA